MKIIQIEVSAVSACQGGHAFWETLFALTDDGKILYRDHPTRSGDMKTEWQELDLPQR